MPTARYKNLTPERQHEIVAVAAAEFAAHGFERASLNRMLSTLGMSKGALYYYFNDKEDLFVHTVLTLLHRFQKPGNMEELFQNAETFWDDVLRLSLELGRQGLSDPTLVALYRHVLALRENPQLALRLKPVFAIAEEWHSGFLRAGQRLGTIRTDLPFDLLMALVHGLDLTVDSWAMNHFAEKPLGEMETFFEADGPKLLDLARRMLSP